MLRNIEGVIFNSGSVFFLALTVIGFSRDRKTKQKYKGKKRSKPGTSRKSQFVPEKNTDNISIELAVFLEF